MREENKTEAEIFRDVAMAAIKETWKGRMINLVIIVSIAMFEILGFVSDLWKLDLLKQDLVQSQQNHAQLMRNYNAFKGNQKWAAFSMEPQHKSVIAASCTVHHHKDPVWDDAKK